MEINVRSFMERFIAAIIDFMVSFVVDIATDEQGKVWVVEINPFDKFASACLFDWNTDRAQMMGKRSFCSGLWKHL